MHPLSDQENAKANAVPGLEWMSPAEARALEPNVHCSGALLSKSSGVIDSHGLMADLLVRLRSFRPAALAVGAWMVPLYCTERRVAFKNNERHTPKVCRCPFRLHWVTKRSAAFYKEIDRTSSCHPRFNSNCGKGDS
jgi:hypothetical protein